MNYSIIFDYFINWIEINFILSLFLFFIFIFIYSAFSLPGLPLFFIFLGYSIGIFWAFVICTIATTCGCGCFFIVSKFFVGKYLDKYLSKYSNKVSNFIKNSSIEYLIIFRLIPGTPLMIQNIILSFLDISIYKILFATIVGFSPFIFFTVFIGNKIKDISDVKTFSLQDIFTLDFFIILCGFIVFFILRIFFKKNN